MTTTPTFAGSDVTNVTDPATDASPSTELRRFREYTYWSLVGVAALLLLLFTTSVGVPRPWDPIGTVALVAVLVVLAAVLRLAEQLIPRRPDERPLSPRARRAWTIVGGVGASVTGAIWAAFGEAWLWALAPAMVTSFVVAELPKVRRRRAVPVVLGIGAVVSVAVGVVLGDEPLAAYVVGGIVVTGFWLFMTLATVWTWHVVVQLDEARRTAAALAVANERLRFAADLHDIQGHSLQVIALKSELAGRLVSHDPSAATEEITAVQQLAVDALRDTRSVVEGYRRTSLDAEIANATNVLESAGIDARLHRDDRFDATTLPSELRHLLGLFVRETVTNVLRHSTADRAELTLRLDDGGGRLRLAVTNDGAERDPTAPAGGLRQLAERLDHAGGHLTWHREDERFEVVATVPVRTTSTSPGAAAPRGSP